VLALALRVGVLAAFVEFPGVADPNHYYNLGVRLATGYGYTTDSIWQFNDDYGAVTHPDDYWMPLTGLLAGGSMAIFGVGVGQALIPFMLIGSLLPLIAYYGAGTLGVGRGGALFAAACAACLPELVLNSVRTETTVVAAFTTGAALILFARGMGIVAPDEIYPPAPPVRGEKDGARGNSPRLIGVRGVVFAASGIMTGLAYLTRSESVLILVAAGVVVLVWALLRRPIPRAVVLLPIAAVLVAVPWSARNLALNGTISTPTTSSLFFLTDYNDHYVYGRSLGLDHLLANQTPTQIIGKRLFESAAAVKLTITTLDGALAAAVIGGLLLLVVGRDRERLLAAAPALILIGGYFIFYAWLAPYKSQGGSFKKAYLSLVPLLLPIAALALERAIVAVRLRRGAMAIVLLLTAANAVDLVRLDAAASGSYLAGIEIMADAARALPDRTGDGAITLMTQDPFIVSYVGFPTVVFPHEPRDVVIAVARRYGVDYLLMPAARPALDPILLDAALDPRFVRVAAVAGTPFVFYALEDAP